MLFKFYHSRICKKKLFEFPHNSTKTLHQPVTIHTRRGARVPKHCELKRDAEGGGLNSHTEREMSSLRNDEWKSCTMINYCKRTRPLPLFCVQTPHEQISRGKTQVNQENHHIMGFCGWVGWWGKKG